MLVVESVCETWEVFTRCRSDMFLPFVYVYSLCQKNVVWLAGAFCLVNCENRQSR